MLLICLLNSVVLIGAGVSHVGGLKSRAAAWRLDWVTYLAAHLEQMRMRFTLTGTVVCKHSKI